MQKQFALRVACTAGCASPVHPRAARWRDLVQSERHKFDECAEVYCGQLAHAPRRYPADWNVRGGAGVESPKAAGGSERKSMAYVLGAINVRRKCLCGDDAKLRRHRAWTSRGAFNPDRSRRRLTHLLL